MISHDGPRPWEYFMWSRPLGAKPRIPSERAPKTWGTPFCKGEGVTSTLLHWSTGHLKPDVQCAVTWHVNMKKWWFLTCHKNQQGHPWNIKNMSLSHHKWFEDHLKGSLDIFWPNIISNEVNFKERAASASNKKATDTQHLSKKRHNRISVLNTKNTKSNHRTSVSATPAWTSNTCAQSA